MTNIKTIIGNIVIGVLVIGIVATVGFGLMHRDNSNHEYHNLITEDTGDKEFDEKNYKFIERVVQFYAEEGIE